MYEQRKPRGSVAKAPEIDLGTDADIA